MAKQRNRRVAVQSSDTFVGSEVHARGAQQTGPGKAARNAASLSAALGLGATVMADHQASQAKAGALAAQQGEVDLDTLREQDKSAAWVHGAEQIIGRSRAIEDEAALKQWYATEFDKNKDLPTLRAEMNAWMKDRYEGLDPSIAKEVAPYLSRGANILMTAHGASETAEGIAMVQNGLATSTNEWLSRPASERTAEEWKAQRDEYTAMYPSREEGLKALAGNMAMAAIQNKSELDLAENPMFEHMRTNPATREILEKGIEEAKKERIADYMENSKVERSLIATEADMLAATGTDDEFYAFLAEHSTTREDGLPPSLSDADVGSAVDARYSTTTKAVLTPLMVEQVQEGNVYMVPEKFRDEAFENVYAQLQEQYGDGADRRMVQTVLRGGFMPTILKDMLNLASPSNPERMAKAHSLYAEFEAQRPGELPKLGIKEARLRQLDTYAMIGQDYEDPNQIVEIMRNHDTSRINQWSPQDKKEAIEGALREISDVDWSWTELQRRPSLRKQVMDRLAYFAGYDMTHEQAAEAAVKYIDSHNRVIDGELFPNNAPFGVNGEAAVEWYVESQGGGRLVPDHTSANFAILRDDDSIFGEGTRVSIRDIVAQYDAHQQEVLEQAAAERNAKVTEEYRQRAIDRLLPDVPRYIAVEGRVRRLNTEGRDAAWANISEQERLAVFERLREEDEADRQSRDAARHKALFETRM